MPINNFSRRNQREGIFVPNRSSVGKVCLVVWSFLYPILCLPGALILLPLMIVAFYLSFFLHLATGVAGDWAYFTPLARFIRNHLWMIVLVLFLIGFLFKNWVAGILFALLLPGCLIQYAEQFLSWLVGFDFFERLGGWTLALLSLFCILFPPAVVLLFIFTVGRAWYVRLIHPNFFTLSLTYYAVVLIAASGVGMNIILAPRAVPSRLNPPAQQYPNPVQPSQRDYPDPLFYDPD